MATSTPKESAFQREADIARILGHHGWGYLHGKFSRQGNGDDSATPVLPLPQVLCQILIDLGPTYVKLGQLLSTRPDMLPPAYIEALSSLQSDVPPVAWEVIQPHIEQALGCPIPEVFSQFNEQVIAAGSLGQVYEATLPSGEKVAVKVQRPGMRPVIDADLRVLRQLAKRLGNSRFAESYDLDGLIEEFQTTIYGELDFSKESRNTLAIAEGLHRAKHWPAGKLRTAKVYEDLSSEQLLVLEWVNGKTLTKADIPKAQRLEIARWVEQMILQQFFIDGFFYADSHPGNFFYVQDGDDFQVVLLDCGMVGRLDPRTQKILIDLFVGIMDENPRRMAQAIVELGYSRQPADAMVIQDGCNRIVRQLYTQSLQDFKLGNLMNEVLAIPRDNHIQLPGSVNALAKAVANAEGVARTLDPKLPMMEVARPLVTEAVRKRFIGKDSLQAAGYTSLYNLQSWASMPERLEALLDQMERSELGFQFHWPRQPDLQHTIHGGVKRVVLALLSVGCILAGAQLISADSSAATTLLGLHLIWGNVLLGLGLGIAVWLVVMLVRNRV